MLEVAKAEAGFASFDWPEEEVVVAGCYHWAKATSRSCLVLVMHLQWHLATKR